MKITKSYIASVLLLSGVFAACDDDMVLPPAYIPQATLTANTTIADLKAEYWQDAANYVTQVGTTADGKHVVVSGRIISNDEAGNIYKSLVIQDATGALAFSINQGDLYEDGYRVGQEIVVDLTGGYIGKYSGLQQAGSPGEYNGTPQADRMTYEEFQAMAQFNGMPDVSAIDTLTTTLDALDAAKKSSAELQKYQSRLIKLDEVSFAEGGIATFADASGTTNRTLFDKNGNSIIVRNSNYSTFASDKLPAGTGSVVGILSYFSSAGWQLLLRSADDCIGFTGESVTPETPTVEANTTIADLKAAYWDDATNYLKTVGTTDSGDDIVIKGRVISSDETGNIYKTLYIQDETAALSISLDNNKIYQTYQLGQEIAINMTGAFIGKYAGLQQMGAESEHNGTPQTGRLEPAVFNARVTMIGDADASKVNAITTTIDVINAATTAEGLRTWQNQLVKLEKVYFVDGGTKPYSEESATTNRTVKDASGNEIIVRNSNYATFKNEILPKGNGTIVGVLGYFNGKWQLYLRDTNDCSGFPN